MIRELTRQQIDPAGSTGMRVVTIALTGAAFVYAVALTTTGIPEVTNPAFTVAALAALAVACAILVAMASPYRAPLTARTHFVVHALALAAALFEVIGHWGHNQFIRDDWGAISLGLLLVALGSYRPMREIVTATTVSALFFGFVTLLEVPNLATKASPIAFVIVATVPLLSLGYAAAVFSREIVESISRWQRRASEASRSLVKELRDGITRSVQQDRVTILNRDVLPFFTELLAAGQISNRDRERAREIADSIRRVMVEEVDRSWLENVIELAGGSGPGRSGAAKVVVDDEHRVAALMATDQRTALRALLVALIETSNFDRSDLRISLSRSGPSYHGRLVANLTLSDFLIRSNFAPYFAVIRSVFTDMSIDFDAPTLTLRFSYEQQ
ncbi:MAG TPA: hypothetical protein DCP11_03125 [Microbacteriaceae bacterium]|jgi:hypothetical protein|nr:hypothetical protein [Microbacteriaceae bacterium]